MGSALVTMNSFQDVPVGATTSEVEEMLGKPYAIHNKSGDIVEYEYIERLTAGPRDFEERHYYIIFKNDRVVSRRVKTNEPVPYLFDSYEMQTTQK
jgi:outer membrane protein assembly factor BamE (lipoprotein component of BamABCDE complex)